MEICRKLFLRTPLAAFLTPLAAFLTMLAACAAPCFAQGNYSQATYLSTSEFFSSLKQVSLDLRSPDTSLAKFISLEEQRSQIESALGGYGIAVRPNSQVTLVASVTHHDESIVSKDVTTGQVDSTTVVHGIYINLQFFLRAAALRNGKLHLVVVAPAISWSGSTQAEDSGLRKVLLGDRTRQDIRDRFVRILGDCLKDIASTTTGDEVGWVVNSWTPAAKAALDADYTRLMRPGVPVDQSPLEGLNYQLQINLDPEFNEPACKADPGWMDAWTNVFRRLRWTGPPQQGGVALNHFFSCVYAYGPAAPRYYALSDRIYIIEPNVVFEFNGKLIRKRAELMAVHHEVLALEDTVADRLADFTPRNIQDFLTDLVLGNGPAAPPVVSAPTSSAPAVPPPAPPAPAPAIPAPKPAAPAAANALTAVLIRLFGKELGQTLVDAGKTTPGLEAVTTEAKGRTAMRQWVRDDLTAYIAASADGFNAYKKGAMIVSGAYRNWTCGVMPALAKNCWVVEGDTQTTMSCLLLEASDLNGLRAFYTQLNEDITASLPAGWTTNGSQPYGGDLPSKSYTKPNGAHGEVWVARAASDGKYELHFQLVSAPMDDPIGAGGFITPPSR